jgi:hypothetical protein
MTTNPASLWEPEAQWALREWNARFEAERQQLFEPINAVNQPRTYVQLGAAAKRSFEVVSDQLLHRARDLLAKRDVAEQIGAPEAATEVIVGPLERRALEAVPDGANVAAARGMLNAGMLSGPLQQTAAELRAAAASLRTAIRNEIEARLAQLAATKQAAAQRAASERWQRWHQLSGIVRNLWPLVLAIVAGVGYIAGHFNVLTELWHAISDKLWNAHRP